MPDARRQAFLLLTHRYDRRIAAEHRKLERAARGLGDAQLLFHAGRRAPEVPLPPGSYRITDESLRALGYPMLYDGRVVPGSVHFPLLRFFRDFPHYAHYWLIEYDVRFTGDWRILFRHFGEDDDDLLTCHIRSHADEPSWLWWRLQHPTQNIALARRLRCFNPIFRVSARGLAHIDRMHRSGWRGHNEVLFPTLLRRRGFAIRDMGGIGRFVAEGDRNRFYLERSLADPALERGSLRYRPVYRRPGRHRNKLYHPVK